jgi:hypothetical protein
MPRKSTKIPCTCERCGAIRLRYPSAVADGVGRFCSNRCRYTPRELLAHPTDLDALLVPLTKGLVAIIDRADGDSVAAHQWAAHWNGQQWYAKRNPDYLHRFLMGYPKGVGVDHIDGDGLNCRRSNMRPATKSQNGCNRKVPANNTSGFKGVRWDKDRRKWRAEIALNGHHYYLGRFDSAEDAVLAYDAKARELHGNFSKTNH